MEKGKGKEYQQYRKGFLCTIEILCSDVLKNAQSHLWGEVVTILKVA